MRRPLIIAILAVYAMNANAECQSCNAPRTRRVQRYKAQGDYQPARRTRRAERVVQPVIETRPARVQKRVAPQEIEMMDLEEVMAAEPKPTMQMIPTPQAKAAQLPKPTMVVADAELVRAKIHQGESQINYTASLGKSGALVHVVETKPVEATLSGKMIVPQVVDGQMKQTERALSPQEAQMYHQKIKAAAQAA